MSSLLTTNKRKINNLTIMISNETIATERLKRSEATEADFARRIEQYQKM